MIIPQGWKIGLAWLEHPQGNRNRRKPVTPTNRPGPSRFVNIKNKHKEQNLATLFLNLYIHTLIIEKQDYETKETYIRIIIVLY